MRRRLIIIAAVGLVGIIAARLGLPRQSAASSHSPNPIVRLVSRDCEIVVTTGPAGPLYRVIRAGQTTAEAATLDQLRLLDPAAYDHISTGTADSASAPWASID